MQFNFVVSTNDWTMRLWQPMKLAIAGRLPLACNNPNHGYVDALVMFQSISSRCRLWVARGG